MNNNMRYKECTVALSHQNVLVLQLARDQTTNMMTEQKKISPLVGMMETF